MSEGPLFRVVEPGPPVPIDLHFAGSFYFLSVRVGLNKALEVEIPNEATPGEVAVRLRTMVAALECVLPNV